MTTTDEIRRTQEILRALGLGSLVSIQRGPDPFAITEKADRPPSFRACAGYAQGTQATHHADGATIDEAFRNLRTKLEEHAGKRQAELARMVGAIGKLGLPATPEPAAPGIAEADTEPPVGPS